MDGRGIELNLNVSRLQIRNGVIVGAIVYVAGVLVSFIPGGLYRTDAGYGSGELVMEGFDAALVIFYNSQFSAGFSRRVTLTEQARPQIRNVLLTGEYSPFADPVLPLDSPIPPVLMFLVPVVGLLVGGVALNRASGRREGSARTAVVTGALITLGYLPLIVLGTTRFTDHNVLRTVLIAGLLYPVVLGGLGGYLSHRLARSRAGTASRVPADQGVTFSVTWTQVRNGILGGTVAYVAGVCLALIQTPIYVWSGFSGLSLVANGLDAALLIFYNAHLIGFFGLPTGDEFPLIFQNVLFSTESTQYGIVVLASPLPGEVVPPASFPDAARALWVLVPVVILLSTGFVLDQLYNERDASVETAMTTGALVVLGYLPLVLLGTVRFTDIELIKTTLIAGILYPVVLGGLGGYLSHRIGPIGIQLPILRSRLETD